MRDHEDHAERLEAEASDMQAKSDQLAEEIGDVREDWEAKKADDGVPGAPSPEGGLPPEANYTTRGDDPPDDSDAAEEPWRDE